MDTHTTADERMLSDIEQARTIVIASSQEVPSWLDSDRERRAGYFAAQALAVIREHAARNHMGTSTRIQPVVPDVPVREITTYLSREEAVVGVIKNRLTPLPITNHRCIACGELVDLCKPDEFGVSRVAGDSEYGYEAYHVACNV